MTAESERRRGIAQSVVSGLAAHTELRASLLTGSAAQETSDEHSDIDLINYYDVLPDPRAFREVLVGLGAVPMGEISPPRPEGFACRFQMEGIEVQTGGELIAALEGRLESIAAGEVDWITAKVAMGLLEGVPLFGHDLIRMWQQRAAYPESLRRREVESNLGFFPIWKVDGQLASRDAELFRRQMLLDGAFRVVAVLSAVNRLYFSTFQFKRAGAHCAGMAVAPERLAERLDFVANAAPSEAAGELGRLVEETKSIVRAEMPDVDADVPWQPIRGQNP